MARLRKKECWLAYGEALAAGMSLTKAAAHGGVHLTTSFRWRHRFLKAPAATQETLGGVVEADETFFRRSHKIPVDGAAPRDRSSGAPAAVASGRASGDSRPSRSRP